MLLEATVAIEPRGQLEGDETALIAATLVKMGGPMISWSPEMNGAPAKAVFRFGTEAARERFLAEALALPGVTLAR